MLPRGRLAQICRQSVSRLLGGSRRSRSVRAVAQAPELASQEHPGEKAETKPCPVSSYNEWDPLEEVIVGSAQGSRVPYFTKEIHAARNPGRLDNTELGRTWAALQGKPFPPELTNKAEAEVNEFIRILEGEGVTVRRPEPIDWNELGEFKTPDFTEGGFVNACPRDSLVVVGNEIIESTMSWRCRVFQNRPFKQLCNEYFLQGAKWTCAPQPIMKNGLLYDETYPLDSKESMLERVVKGEFLVKETQPCFDAADILRAGRDIFVQLSHVTNRLGIEWLQRQLGPDYRVHSMQFLDANCYHIDATFLILRPGLALMNPAKPPIAIDGEPTNVKRFFESQGWETVECPELSNPKGTFFSSKWIAMNMLSLDENRVLCDRGQTSIHDMLEKYGIEPIKVNFEAAHWFNGSFHCWTVDTRRKGSLQSYF